MTSGGSEANDLLNRRDGLVQDLSKIVSINQFGEGGGDFVITLGGRVLVQGTARQPTSAASSTEWEPGDPTGPTTVWTWSSRAAS